MPGGGVMLERLDDYDWAKAFECCNAKPSVVIKERAGG
jgi:hypothetical protein